MNNRGVVEGGTRGVYNNSHVSIQILSVVYFLSLNFNFKINLHVFCLGEIQIGASTGKTKTKINMMMTSDSWGKLSPEIRQKIKPNGLNSMQSCHRLFLCLMLGKLENTTTDINIREKIEKKKFERFTYACIHLHTLSFSPLSLSLSVCLSLSLFSLSFDPLSVVLNHVSFLNLV